MNGRREGVVWLESERLLRDRDRAFSETQTVLKVHPKVKLIMAIAAPAVPHCNINANTDAMVIRRHTPQSHAWPKLGGLVSSSRWPQYSSTCAGVPAI